MNDTHAVVEIREVLICRPEFVFSFRWGYDLYPERRGEKYKPSFARIALLGEGREASDKIKCEKNVWNCVQSSMYINLILALCCSHNAVRV